MRLPKALLILSLLQIGLARDEVYKTNTVLAYLNFQQLVEEDVNYLKTVEVSLSSRV